MGTCSAATQASHLCRELRAGLPRVRPHPRHLSLRHCQAAGGDLWQRSPPLILTKPFRGRRMALPPRTFPEGDSFKATGVGWGGRGSTALVLSPSTPLPPWLSTPAPPPLAARRHPPGGGTCSLRLHRGHPTAGGTPVLSWHWAVGLPRRSEVAEATPLPPTGPYQRIPAGRRASRTQPLSPSRPNLCTGLSEPLRCNNSYRWVSVQVQ